MADRLFTTARTVRFVDAIVVAWVVVWVVLGLAVAREVHGLRDLSETVVAAGLAAEEAGRAVSLLDNVPFVGEDVDRFADRAQEAGRSAQVSGRASRRSAENLAVLLGIAIAIVPTLPLLALYAPARIGWRRDVRAIRRALAAEGDDPAFREFLARRALERMPYARLKALGGSPWRDVDAGRYDRLADAELERLGITGARRP